MTYLKRHSKTYSVQLIHRLLLRRDDVTATKVVLEPVRGTRLRPRPNNLRIVSGVEAIVRRIRRLTPVPRIAGLRRIPDLDLERRITVPQPRLSLGEIKIDIFTEV